MKLGTRYLNIRKGREWVTPGTNCFFLACVAIECGGDASGLVSRRPTRTSSALIKAKATSGEQKPEIAHQSLWHPG